jgi:hypothetical protein
VHNETLSVAAMRVNNPDRSPLESIADQRANRRSHLPGYAAWEIHPVMKLEVQ